ncbi:MAG: glucosaminidase domain-containing protein [Firmicutes bacterium]|uniref:Glucosaminidase domain-containing protein n=1 Tax=Candidatus Gallilactobacillus intestinavium TaxID=2840838 RepID=A0A9D9E7R6_9LACO|nr:glucosaminidase domain-containing protein [Candidatus Gallilactobacillus intestinavium]
MLYGWQKINGHTYYFDVNTGSMYVGTQTINGKQYHFDSNGEESPIINFRNLYGSHLDFVNSLINGAIQGWNEYGILPSVTIAQAILESGWGQSYLSTAAHNLFGIKGSYNGQSIILPTKEWNGYEYVTINDSFRRYDNNSESVADHGYFLTINSRYNNLHWQRDYHTVCELLQQDGYATAPTYANSLINIIDCYGLNSVDQSLF